MTWAHGDKIAKGSAIHRIVQPNAGTDTVRCSLVDSTGTVVWHADIAAGKNVEWSTHPPWIAPDDLTVQLAPPPAPVERQTLVAPPAPEHLQSNGNLSPGVSSGRTTPTNRP